MDFIVHGFPSLSIVRKISDIGFQPVIFTSQAGSLCHIQRQTVVFRTMLTSNKSNAVLGIRDLGFRAFPLLNSQIGKKLCHNFIGMKILNGYFTSGASVLHVVPLNFVDPIHRFFER